jgi:hypothetical protein
MKRMTLLMDSLFSSWIGFWKELLHSWIVNSALGYVCGKNYFTRGQFDISFGKQLQDRFTFKF